MLPMSSLSDADGTIYIARRRDSDAYDCICVARRQDSDAHEPRGMQAHGRGTGVGHLRRAMPLVQRK